MKTTCLRARQLEIAIFCYGPSKGLRATYHSEKKPRSRIRGVGSGSQVIGRGAVSLFLSYYLWKFGSFLCFFSFVVSLLCNPNKILFPHCLSFCCSGVERLFEWFEVFLLCLLYENSTKLPSKGDSSLNGLRHLLMLGANHSLCVFGVDFQLYGQLK